LTASEDSEFGAIGYGWPVVGYSDFVVTKSKEVFGVIECPCREPFCSRWVGIEQEYPLRRGVKSDLKKFDDCGPKAFQVANRPVVKSTIIAQLDGSMLL
jgi:hypothetical protein